MGKMKISKQLVIFILILLIVWAIAIYTISISEKDVSQQTVWLIIAGMLVYTIVGIIVTIKIYHKKEIKPEKAVLYIMLVFCTLFMVVIPVGRGHDEIMHWYKAFEISQGQLTTPILKDKRISYTVLPKGTETIIIERDNKDIYKYVDNILLLHQKINYEEKTVVVNQNSTAYCFVQYIPQVIGILIGKMITQTPLLMAYLARLVNMIICIICMYYAVKIIPFGKNIILVLSIIPIAIEGFSTMSPDGITIAICALFIAYTLSIAFNENKKCGIKETVLLTLLGAIVSLCKIVYMPLIFLVCIIPKEKFTSKKSRIISLSCIIGIGMLCNFIWLIFGSMALLQSNTNTYMYGQENATMLKITSLLNNPILYIQKIFYTIGIKANDYFLSLFGGQLEWSESVCMQITPYIVCGICILAAIAEEKTKMIFQKYQKRILLGIVIIITILIFTSLYIQWSDTKLAYIDGVQGRYFLPILPLILLLISSMKIKIKYTNLQVTKLICIASIGICLYSTATILAIHL